MIINNGQLEANWPFHKMTLLTLQVHCIEPADIDDQKSSSDTLHVFNDYKPSYADIR